MIDKSLEQFDRYNNLVEMFLARVAEQGDAPFLWAKHDGAWQPTSWNEAAAQMALMAQGLKKLGLKKGDRVMLVAENRPEWCIADLAIMAAGCVTVPTYTTNTERDHLHILNNSRASAVIVSGAKLAQTLLPAVLQSTDCQHVIGMEDLNISQASSYDYSLWEKLTEGDDAAISRALDTVRAEMESVKRDDLACLIYTSGTGGAPRGVMQHHGAILHNVKGPAEVIKHDFSWDDEVFLSFLPLSHAYEHSAGQFFPIGLGAQIYYSEGLEKLASNIEEVRPTLMVVVPRLFEVLRTRMLKTLKQQGKAANYLLDKALKLGEKEAAGKKRLIDKPMHFVLNRTLRPKVSERFGGRIKAMVSGGAPLNPEIGIFFQALGLTMLQGYGQTEAAPIIACNRPKTGLKMDTVGPPLMDTEVTIADDGEILVRGELVMHGYWRNEEETARVLKDGWLHTGDIGHIDEAGRIVITDRKKDLIVNDKGDNVSPQKVEGMLTLQPEILQAMVSGDKRPYVVGLVVPDPEWALEWARNEGKKYDFTELQDCPAFKTAVRAAVDRVNKDLSVIEKVRRFVFADEPFAIENEEMTPSMKIRRHVIRQRYQERIDGMYKS
ncbi:AMP-dependent synthetase/ligase [Alterisphingorhabdus coralli]|uniref:AMP-dependent synthetase/ligase n=1 Tax=Alterisphingorhabdus coralli TaxID=3071408 RepID=A0AA97F8M5_9SPHN|nr:AMP-dependent synthetase/ligase [Parasphingorhabdus sp. SCSIO 66989]WOE75308.1 AMP-dependent synthetase/ligase [Parasphingorhabdus sp. SCSIO 66989]